MILPLAAEKESSNGRFAFWGEESEKESVHVQQQPWHRHHVPCSLNKFHDNPRARFSGTRRRQKQQDGPHMAP